jgi:large subunit ribosomal protein L9
MKVLLLQDVYNLGRAGEVKKVANGYGRNFLVPHGLAVLATPGALVSVDRIKKEADAKRVVLNKEMGEVAEKMVGLQLVFPAKASETGKLYGSVTSLMVANELTEKLGVEITKRNIQAQPLKLLGLHTIKIQLTIDLIPEIDVVIHREGEPVENYMIRAELLFEGVEEQEDDTEFEPAIYEPEPDQEEPAADAEVEQTEAEDVQEEEVSEDVEENTEETETE